MPRKTPEVKVYRRQLLKPELLKLAAKKKLKNIPSKWSKSSARAKNIGYSSWISHLSFLMISSAFNGSTFKV
jgi:hypothetical protein